MKKKNQYLLALQVVSAAVILLFLVGLGTAAGMTPWMSGQAEEGESGLLLDGADRDEIWSRQGELEDIYTAQNRRLVNRKMEERFLRIRELAEQSELADVFALDAFLWGQDGGSESIMSTTNPTELLPEGEDFTLKNLFWKKMPEEAEFQVESAAAAEEAQAAAVTQEVPAETAEEEEYSYNVSYGWNENYAGVGYTIYWTNIMDRLMKDLPAEQRQAMEEKFYGMERCEHAEQGDWSAYTMQPITDYLYVPTCGKDGVADYTNMLLLLSHTGLPEELEAAGFTGIREWMEAAEENEAMRLYYSRGMKENTSVYSREAVSMVQQGVKFFYSQNQFTITFLDATSMLREEFRESVEENLEDGWLVHHSAAGGKVDYLELRGPEEESILNPHKRKCSFYYQDGKMMEMELRVKKEDGYSQRDSDQRDDYIDEQEKGTLLNFMEEMGLTRQEGESLLQKVNQNVQEEGAFSSVDWKTVKTRSEIRLIITVR